MQTRLHALSISIISFAATLNAQVVPGEVPGDLGSILLNTETLTLVRAADGHAWLQQNLGATAVATTVDQTTALGHLYQWGRWNDGHQVRTSATASVTTLAVNNPSGLGTGSALFYTGTDQLHWWSNGDGADSWQGVVASTVKGIDPCTALGPEWQLPSQADWMAVLAAEGITGVTTALTSNLRLPAAGSRNALSGSIINESAFGNYWSSTASGIYAKDLTIGDGFVNADDDGYRGYGMSCRCLNKSLHTGIDDAGRAEGDRALHLYPNPAVEHITILCADLVGQRATIEVFDASGRRVHSEQVGALPALWTLTAATEWHNGLYFVQLRTAGGMRSARVVLQR